MYSNRSEYSGIGAFGFADNGDVLVRGTVGNVSYQVHKFDRTDVRMNWIMIACISIGAGFAHVPLGVALGLGTGAASPEIGEQPGMVEGDNRLTIGTFYPTGAPDSYYGTPITPGNRSTYEYTFRNGLTVSHGSYAWQVYVPHRPF